MEGILFEWRERLNMYGMCLIMDVKYCMQYMYLAIRKHKIESYMFTTFIFAPRIKLNIMKVAVTRLTNTVTTTFTFHRSNLLARSNSTMTTLF